MDGSKSKAAVSFSKTLRALLVDEGEKTKKGKEGDSFLKLKNVEWLVKSVWQKAISGESWAVSFIAERVEGKVSQQVDLDGNLNLGFQANIDAIEEGIMEVQKKKGENAD